MDHEEAVVKAFIIPSKRERYLGFLTSPKRREKFIAQLPHFNHLNPKFVVPIPPNQHDLLAVMRLLASKGAGSKCWVISQDSKLDSREMDLQDALKETIGYQAGTIISCIPGKLAYFENEDERCILQR